MFEAISNPTRRAMLDRLRSGPLPVRDLAAELAVSLITTRRAYTDLEAAGLIVSRQGQGTFVADEIARASHAQSRKDALEHLEQALQRARGMGLDDDEIRQLLEQLLKNKRR